MKDKINSVLQFFKKYGIYAVLVGAVCAFLITDIIVRKPEKKSDIIFSNGTKSDISSSFSETIAESRNSGKTNSKTKKETKTSVSSKKENSQSKSAEKTQSQTSPVNFPIDINLADKQQLEQINGIGESTAQKIIDYRNSVGTITNLEQLLNISGIGEKTLENLKNYLYVSDSVYEEMTKTSTAQTTAAAKTEESKTSKETHTTSSEQPPTRKPVDINKASAEELEENLLIDSELAENIIKLRKEISYFTNPLELLYAEGMTEKKLQELMPYIDVKQYP